MSLVKWTMANGTTVSGNALTIAVDFDGTLCRECYPNIGEPNTELMRLLNECHAFPRTKLILWTMREGKLLDEAVEWCKSYGLTFDAVNENLPELVEKWGTNPRKIAADIYIDDRAVIESEEIDLSI